MFDLDDKQSVKLHEWMSSHEDVYCGAIGGRYTYMITPTTLGLIYKVKDNITEDEIDLTNYNEW